ncbi:DUF4962 domain-containing protein [Egicoccus sp. AB-alg2]|uniref:DUF4962 domain-containing protein n=1 Tax=Egicoccus sp. AB-alg2 TaxID=3242693 RepID=UPI00359CBDD1
MTDVDRSKLLLPGRRLQRLREEIRDVRASQFRRLYEQADWYRHQQPPAEHPTASITFFGPAAANLSLLHLLTDQDHYLDEARRWIFTAARYPHWGKAHMPDHDLDAGWLSYGLSLAYSWIGDRLPAAEREELEAKLLLQGQRLYDFAVESEGGWWSSSYWQNHNWICYAGLATAGYALQDRHPEAREWTKRAEENFRKVLELLPEDGSNCEGVVYWRYGVPWIATYLDVLEQATGTDLFPDSPYLRETFWYRLYQAAPNLEEIVNHGDCHDRRSGHSVAFYYLLAKKYRLPQAQWLARQVAERGFWREAYESGVKPGVMPEAFQELLWYDPTVPEQDVRDLPTQRYFPDLGLVVARTGWDRDATMVSFKASPGGGHKAWERAKRFKDEDGWDTLNAGHHHPDANAFVLLSRDAFLAIDDGYANRKRAANHNLVLVDGQGFVNEDRYHVYKELPYQHQARIRSHAAGAGYVHAVGESAAMYEPALGVRQVDRHLWFSPLGHTVLLDRLAADADRTWTWLLHSDHPATADAERLHRIRKARARLDVHHVRPDALDTEIGETEIYANPTASTPSLEIRRVQQTLRVHAGPAREATFLAVLDARDDHDPDTSHVTALDVDGEGQAVRIERGSDVEVVLLEVAAGATAGDVSATGAAAVAAQADGRQVLGVAHGTRVARGGREVVASATASVFVTWDAYEVGVDVSADTDVEVTVTADAPVSVRADGVAVVPEDGRVRLHVPAGTHRVTWTR